ncbi:hypothetical protein HA72_0948 [Metallosphaera sedula]|uniref:Uncharacterized protein n=3 Tax=Metallosphaera TaxID=41980 RepID=A4YFB8_METS5|nr:MULTISPECIES: hypothetical protein [Metallosphaera]ABP95120.1 hypothetical protein Msed_0948 [Metallosphaera sedula DSM 5348]AIM27106.1 hypothetical protein HA72_0948 [Metallosphaera sedula]AKV74014.1 hypothetical protein MsedA_0963 [Metallosphaera sedula]AKV76253.1 hypothetical protein MsedB_0964 [Metallosphaera sedula]AKV78506.1 hypothetical protein MsedC_0963 [Metallosphaera sedula]
MNLLRFLIKYTGIDSTIKEAINDAIGSDPEALKLLYPRRAPPIDGTSEMLKIAENLGIKVQKSERSQVDLRRLAAAQAANVTPIEVKNPEDVLWEIAQRFRVKRSGNH